MLQSLPRVFQTVNFLLQIVAQQVFESIRQFFQLIFQFYFFAGESLLRDVEFSRDQSFPCRATKTLSQQTSRFVADWTIVSFLEIFLAFYRTKIIVSSTQFLICQYFFQSCSQNSADSFQVYSFFLVNVLRQTKFWWLIHLSSTSIKSNCRCIDHFVILCAKLFLLICSRRYCGDSRPINLFAHNHLVFLNSVRVSWFTNMFCRMDLFFSPSSDLPVHF